jgi:hypothetical protein
VFDKDGKKLASVGGLGYADYLYIKSHTAKYACRKLYRIRHERDRHVEEVRGFRGQTSLVNTTAHLFIMLYLI